MFGEDITAYLPEHIKPFSDQLKQFPVGYEKWVYATSLPADTYQRDVFVTVSFAIVDEEGDLARADRPGMVVSNTCDLQPEQARFILVVPVVDLKDYRENSELEAEALENHIRALTENKISQLMFLPEGGRLHSCFVDFGNICSVSSRHFHSENRPIRFTKLESLSQCGHYFLLIKFAYHLSRPEAPEATRE